MIELFNILDADDENLKKILVFLFHFLNNQQMPLNNKNHRKLLLAWQVLIQDCKICIVKKDKIVRSRVEKENDILIVCGGRTGRDGIHGVNFASKNAQ